MALRWAVRLLVVMVVAYAVVLLGLVLLQRKLMYFPAGAGGAATSWGLPDAQTFRIPTPDGNSIVAWYQPATADKPLFLLFHGNGGTLSIRADLLRRLAADGSGFLAIDYAGYGGSTGTPSEKALFEDGDAAYARAISLGYPPDRIVIVGESLGTAVAVHVAAHHPARALVLDSAFASALDVAKGRYPIFPVSMVMKDRYASQSEIGRVDMPKLFLHGEKDTIIPIAEDRKLFAAAREPKTFVALPGLGHVVLWAPGVIGLVRKWLAGLPAPDPDSQSPIRSTR